MFTAVLAKISIHKEITSIVVPFELTDIDEILSEIDCQKITLREFVSG